MVPSSALKELIAAIGRENVLTDPESLYLAGLDAMTYYKGRPDVVVRATSAAAVSEVLKIANRHKVPIVSRGGGSSLTGAVVPFQGGIVIDTKSLCDIHMNVDDGVVEAGAGATLVDVDAACRKYGFFFPPDPASLKSVTVGGALSNNSGGMRCARYGCMRNWVLRIQVVLPDGRITWLGEPLYKYRSGYDLLGLFVGAEGTLGVITRAVLKILPLPEKMYRIVATFADLVKACDAISGLRRSGVPTLILELMDREAIKAVNAVFGLSLTEAEAIVLLDLDGYGDAPRELARRAEALLRQFGAADVRGTDDPVEMERLYEGRRGAFAAIARMYPSVIAGDIVVPISKLRNAMEGIQRVREKYGLPIATVGHAGDGNLHPLIGSDANRAGEWERAWRAFDEISQLAIDLGGAVSGEHGIGVEKVEALRKELDAHDSRYTLNFMRQIKQLFDPNGIMNPGKYGL